MTIQDGEKGLVSQENFEKKSLQEDNTQGFWQKMAERTGTGKTIPERVAQLYYAFGLFSSSHPYLIGVFSILVTLISCFPLINLPLPGNKPQEFATRAINYSPPPQNWEGNSHDYDWPKWYKGPPAVYIQQIIIRSGVMPWTKENNLFDAFRGPLSQSFNVVDLLHKIKLNQSDNQYTDLTSYCLYVGEVKSKALKGKISLLPENNCLFISPVNFWQQNFNKFLDDPEILTTIMNYQSNQKRRSGLAEILLGMNVKDTGLKRNPFKIRPRIISYSITLVLKSYDHNFIKLLKSSLLKQYPFKEDSLSNTSNSNGNGNGDTYSDSADERIFHIYYPSQNSLYELVPLIITYIAMFFYVYFSIRKVEIITSKLGVAFAALYTVVACLCMSVGLCSLSGIDFEVNGKAIFPYLVIIIGLENILVLTKSVVSTAKHLDVKIRVAQGLSKEGWGITKNLLTEVTILSIGFFTFIPMIQKFCILAIVGLVSDFFLQTFFFATVLSSDIQRSTNKKQHYGPNFTPFRTPLHPLSSSTKLPRIKSNPRLTQNGGFKTTEIVAPSQGNAPILVKIPKRLRLIYFWAKTRFFQRAFTIFMVGWISIMLYQSGLLAHLNHEPDDIALPLNAAQKENITSRIFKTIAPNNRMLKSANANNSSPTKTTERGGGGGNDDEIDLKLDFINKKIEQELYSQNNPLIWRRLSPFHWQVLLGIYNYSVSSKYISVLPSISLNIPVDPSISLSLRHQHELDQGNNFNWLAISKSHNSMDFIDESDNNVPSMMPIGKIGIKGLISYPSLNDDPYIPTSPIELALAMLLAIPSIIFIAYTVFMFYKVICTRNYAEWRNSWNIKDISQDAYTHVVFEAVPLVLDGCCPQEVECISSDGNIISSVCLAGIVKVWSTTTGENITTIDRKAYYNGYQQPFQMQNNEEIASSIHSDPDSSSSPPNASGFFPQQQQQQNQQHQQLDRRYYYQNQHINTNSRSFEQNIDQQQQQQQHSIARNHLRKNSFSFQNNYTVQHQQFQQQHQQQQQQSNHKNVTDFKRTHQRTSSQPNNVALYHNLSETQPIVISKESSPSPSCASSINNSNSGVPFLQRNPMLNHGGNSMSEKSLEQLNFSSPTYNANTTSGGRGVDIDSPLDNKSYNFNGDSRENLKEIAPVWALDCQENLVIIGTGSGQIEIWDAFTGSLSCTYDDESCAGIVCLKIINNRIIAARISGSLDFLEIESRNFGHGRETSAPYNRWHTGDDININSSNSINGGSLFTLETAELRCIWLTTIKAHQQPITNLEVECGRILTGSSDHSLKVFSFGNGNQVVNQLYTLHGHYAPITCLFIDKISPMTSGSASQEGMLCVWDLLTGMCMYSVQAHDGAVRALTYSASYIISVGDDDKICVWERFQGHILNTIHLEQAYCSQLVMLTHNLLVTSKLGSLIVWDVRSGNPIRVVRLGHRDNSVFVRQIMACHNGILCDYGAQLRLVHFPALINKFE